MPEKTFWIYILLCQNNAYYTGYTTDIERRFSEHLSGSDKCKFTRSFPPLKIMQCWQATNKIDAMTVERYVKKLPRKKKELLISAPKNLLEFFSAVNIKLEIVHI